MPTTKSKRDQSEDAKTLAQSFHTVRHEGVTYIPAHYMTEEISDALADDERTWIPLTRDLIMELATARFGLLFQSDAEIASFDLVVQQCSRFERGSFSTLLIKTEDGLRRLDPDGELRPVTGSFVPNTIPVVLNTDAAAKQKVKDQLTEWLDSEEVATSLLHHLATALAPHWSAVRYVLLIGDGRNGKSLLLTMLEKLFGLQNMASVTRQEIASKEQGVLSLQGKLINIVMDGVAEYVKDSGNEKSLIAGEVVPIRKLYSSTMTPVKTNGLFVEGLNREPKSSDKSSALQRRLARFYFPNIYEDDLDFWDEMTSDESVGALLGLLLDHYVLKSEKNEKLAQTRHARMLALEHLVNNSLAAQFIMHMEDESAFGADDLVDKSMKQIAAEFRSWRINDRGDTSTWDDADVTRLFSSVATMERQSMRVDGQPRRVTTLVGFKDDMKMLIQEQRGEEDASGETVVGD
jgi:hypothetical protein